MTLKNKIEAILLFKNEPVIVAELSKLLKSKPEEVRAAVAELSAEYKDRGIVIVTAGDEIVLGTHPSASSLIEEIQKEELSKDIGRAGLETLAIVLYKGPISRREIDYIRGVNSTFILRTLMIRGLVERTDSSSGERSYSYKPTLKLLEHLGVRNIAELPEYQETLTKLAEFEARTADENAEE